MGRVDLIRTEGVIGKYVGWSKSILSTPSESLSTKLTERTLR